tara:strand:+ start:44 stop:514 length:471 start_codon:yes stop_codon:yes gene_type:complete
MIVYDNVFDETTANLWWEYSYKIYMETLSTFKFDSCSTREVTITFEDWTEKMFTFIKEKYDIEVEKYKRAYCNFQKSESLEPPLHTDLEDIVMIYYTRFDWKEEWGGGIEIGGELVSYKGNRLVICNGSTPHKAMPILKECEEFRVSISFLCNKKE